MSVIKRRLPRKMLPGMARQGILRTLTMIGAFVLLAVGCPLPGALAEVRPGIKNINLGAPLRIQHIRIFSAFQNKSKVGRRMFERLRKYEEGVKGNDALAQHLKHRFNAGIVKIRPTDDDFQRKMDEFVRAGDIVLLDVLGLKPDENMLFGGGRMYFTERFYPEMGFAVYEMLKNAVAHGHGDDLRQPVFLQLIHEKNNLVIRVVDTASYNRTNKKSRFAGNGLGVFYISKVGELSTERIETAAGTLGRVTSLAISANRISLTNVTFGTMFLYGNERWMIKKTVPVGDCFLLWCVRTEISGLSSKTLFAADAHHVTLSPRAQTKAAGAFLIEAAL